PGDGAAAIPPADLTLPEPTVGTRWFTLPAPVLYPNPVRNKLLLRGLPTDQSLDYRILTVAGRELASGRVNSADNAVTTAGLPEGVYFLALHARDGRRTVVRFVKKGW
ncbi:MAG: T9SS type A sorting domain-containing protein, partial [Bacteroidota bacterium]